MAMVSELDLYKRMSENMQAGWYVFDLDEQTLRCSDYLTYIFGFKDCTVNMDDFFDIVRDDFRYKIKSDIKSASIISNNFYEATFPVMTDEHGLLWFHAQQTKNEHGAAKNGGDIIYGLMHIVEEPKAVHIAQGEEVNKPIDRLFSISDSLFNFLNNDNANTINAILEDVRKTLNGDRVYIFEMTDFNRYHHCSYEVVSNGTSRQIDMLSHVDAKDVPWYTENILANRPIILDSLHQIPKEGENEYRLLKKQDIKSLICIPMTNRTAVWGYMGIDMVRNSRKWTNADFQWLSSICNIISIFMELTNTKRDYLREENFVEDLIKYMPIGYAHTSVMRDASGEPVDYIMIDYNEKLKDTILYNMKVTSKGKFGSEHPDKALFAKRMEGFKKVLNSSMPVECELYIPQSGRYTHEISYSPAKDQVVDLYIDKTDYLKSESQIADFENFFSLISQFAKIGYGKFNILTKEGYANKQWMINLGEKEDTELNEVVEVYSKIKEEDRKKILEFYLNAKNGKHRHFSEEVRVIVNESPKEYKWTRMNIIVTKYAPDDNEIELTGINYDITESKNEERELIISRNKAQTMDRLKSAFLANMSHEIRTPLNAIIGFSELLTDAESKEEKSMYLKILKENNDLLLQLISDILDLSKIEAGTFDFTFSNVDINVLCRDIVRSTLMKDTNGVDIIFDENSDDCHIVSDRNRLQQVITNFVNNALKFTKQGSIHIGYQQMGDRLKVYCSDTGIGISKEQQQHVFERFVKLNSFIKGTGLGLAICQTIIQQLHGEIGVDSEPGRGSTFWFILPYEFNGNNISIYNNMAKKALPIPANTTLSGKPLILVAEDNESNYMLLSVLLGNSYRLEWAHDGNEALEMYRNLKPDLILMDIRMPELDGIEATKIIRQRDKKTPIFAVTAYAYKRDKDDALKVGCNAFITKPINEFELKEEINKVLGGQ